MRRTEAAVRVRSTATATESLSIVAFGETHASPFSHGVGAASADGLHGAARRLNALIERQSGRIAAVLHDDVSQVLAATHMTLEDIACDVPPAVQARLRQVRAHLHQVEEQLRGISRQLHPAVVEDFGLADAVTFASRAFSRQTGIQLALSIRLDVPCSDRTADVAFRVVQEALANIAAHAHATSASIGISAQGTHLLCTVCDDGDGFDPERAQATDGHPRLGLQLIRARVEAIGGAFDVASIPRQGTRLRAIVPLER
jgi:signal transduction histidine kinase